MAQARRRHNKWSQPQAAGGNLLSLIVILVLVLGGFFYLFRVLTTSDWLWFSSRFDAQPSQIVVVNHGQPMQILPDDPRFAAITDAFNRSISSGYHDSGMGFSDPTWEQLEQDGLYIDMIYAEPVRLHGNFEPTTRMRLLVSGDKIHRTKVLFRSNETEWARNPYALNSVEPLQQVLERYGFSQK
jgi:hypothetical protein